MNSNISAAGILDLRALAALRNDVAEDMALRHGDGPWSARTSKAMVLRQMRATTVLVARREGEIVGTLRLMEANQSLFDYRAFTPARTALYLIGLAVSPQCRGQGVGRELVESAKAAAREWPAEALWLDTYQHAAGAGSFYEKCGFRRVDSRSIIRASLACYEWRSDW